MKRNFNVLVLTISSTALIAGCTGGGSVGGSGGSPTDNSSSSLQTTFIYATSLGSGSTTAKDSSNRYHVKGNSLSVTGSCVRGITSVQISEGGALFSNESATCDASGNWTWTKVFTALSEQDYSVIFTPVLVDSTVLSAGAITRLIRVDDVAPVAPVITAPSAMTTFTQTSGDTVTISGTFPSDGTKMTGPNSADTSLGTGGLTLGAGTFSQSITLSVGAAVNYSYRVFDLAGNPSADDTIAISYIPSVSLALGGAFPGGVITDSGTNFQVESSMNQLPHFSVSADSFILDLGFNRAVNFGRNQP